MAISLNTAAKNEILNIIGDSLDELHIYIFNAEGGYDVLGSAELPEVLFNPASAASKTMLPASFDIPITITGGIGPQANTGFVISSNTSWTGGGSFIPTSTFYLRGPVSTTPASDTMYINSSTLVSGDTVRVTTFTLTHP